MQENDEVVMIYRLTTFAIVAILCYTRWMMNTFARPVRDLRNNYNEILALANEGNQVVITQNGRDTAVVIGTEAYREFESFLYRKYIQRELTRAKKQAKDPKTRWLSEEEFWDEVGIEL